MDASKNVAVALSERIKVYYYDEGWLCTSVSLPYHTQFNKICLKHFVKQYTAEFHHGVITKSLRVGNIAIFTLLLVITCIELFFFYVNKSYYYQFKSLIVITNMVAKINNSLFLAVHFSGRWASITLVSCDVINTYSRSVDQYRFSYYQNDTKICISC